MAPYEQAEGISDYKLFTDKYRRLTQIEKLWRMKSIRQNVTL